MHYFYLTLNINDKQNHQEIYERNYLRELEPKYLFFRMYFNSNTIIVDPSKLEYTLENFINTNGLMIILNEILFQKISNEVQRNIYNEGSEGRKDYILRCIKQIKL